MKTDFIFRKFQRFLFLSMIISQPLLLTAQQAIIGIVKDKETDAPMPGVTLSIKGSNTGVASDVAGKFIIMADENSVIVFKLLGYKAYEYKVPKAAPAFLTVVLEHDEEALSGVVVTGIFNRPKESYTGAVRSISAKELSTAGNRSVLTSIRNIDPSFNIADNIEIGSDPNKLPKITMRGETTISVDIKDLQSDTKTLRESNLPLIVLDGFEVPLEYLMDMDVNQIDNITLLKDASATAMYGTRGSHGVVVITTKLPLAGRLRISYNGNANVEAPDLNSYNLMNSREKLLYEKAAGLYVAKNAVETMNLQDLYNQRKIDVERGVDTYWLKYPIRVGVGSRHGLGLEGGDGTFRYSANLSYNNVAGVMKGSVRNSFNAGMRMMYNLKKLSFQDNLTIGITNSRNSPYGSFSDFSKINSYWTPYDENGNIRKVMENFLYSGQGKRNIVYNPLYNALLPQKNSTGSTSIMNNFSAEWYILPEFFVRGQFSLSSSKGRADRYISAENTQFDGYTGTDYERRGKYTYSDSYSFSYAGQVTVNYSKTFKENHQMFIGLGWNIEDANSEGYSVVGEGFSVPTMDFLGMAGKYQKDGKPGSSESVSRSTGLLLNASYIYKGRYFLNVSGKYEGSSQFGTNNRFAPFWSTGIGWNIHSEEFLKESSFVNSARIRASYGVTGSQSFSPYLALTTYQDFGGKTYQSSYGLHLQALGNKDLAWEMTNQYNIGIDLGLWGGRFGFGMDIYERITNNLLADVNLPVAAGFENYKANIGQVENQGIEMNFNVQVIRNSRKKFTWSIGANMASNRNKLRKINNSLEFLNEELLANSDSRNPSFLFKEGESMTTLFAVRSKGIDPSNGREIFLTTAGEETYIWDSKDMVAVGNTEPKATGSLITNIRYKGFNVSAYFGYRLGGKVFNGTLASKVENIYPYENADRRVLYDRWKQPGDISKYKSVLDRTSTYATTRFVTTENRLNLSALSVSFDIPAEWSKKHLKIPYISVAGYVEDVMYLSTIRRERGLDYPFSHKFSFSLTVRF
ncbi:MAG: SusC/RagA family TonB-linked outer membrane protein [Prevotellaceae bacterium]|nr:SusC/RagA family TonB-linked outer membrane protein [Prevotellaceae bacterium]